MILIKKGIDDKEETLIVFESSDTESHTAMLSIVETNGDNEIETIYPIRPDEAAALGAALTLWSMERTEKEGLF